MKKKPLKTCPECDIKCHARKATCECGYVFYEKKNRNKVIEDWTALRKGDVIRSVSGNGPYWENPSTWERVYMGSYGKFVVEDVGTNFIRCSKLIKNSRKNYKMSGTHILYMGPYHKSDLCDNLHSCPHKLIGVLLKKEKV
mgnify:FL=1|tara:strand:- start:114 stop:536 length:423 start_codon:yes stop_codon:yes gene_type:complete